MELLVQNQYAKTNSILDATTYSKGNQFDFVQCYFLTKLPIVLSWCEAYQTKPDTSSIFLHIQSTHKNWNAIDLVAIHNGYRTALKERRIQIIKGKLVLLKHILANSQKLALIIVPKPLQQKVSATSTLDISCSSPRWENLTSGYQIYPLKGLNLRYMYCGQKHFSE